MLRKFIILALIETAIFAIGNAVVNAFPEWSPLVWGVTGLTCLTVAWLLWIWDRGKTVPSKILARAAPNPTTWISDSEALVIVRKSSLVRLRLPKGTITGSEAVTRLLGFPPSLTPGEQLADELARKHLRDFVNQCNKWTRNGRYGKETLEWWLDEAAAQRELNH